MKKKNMLVVAFILCFVMVTGNVAFAADGIVEPLTILELKDSSNPDGGVVDEGFFTGVFSSMFGYSVTLTTIDDEVYLGSPIRVEATVKFTGKSTIVDEELVIKVGSTEFKGLKLLTGITKEITPVYPKRVGSFALSSSEYSIQLPYSYEDTKKEVGAPEEIIGGSDSAWFRATSVETEGEVIVKNPLELKNLRVDIVDTTTKPSEKVANINYVLSNNAEKSIQLTSASVKIVMSDGSITEDILDTNNTILYSGSRDLLFQIYSIDNKFFAFVEFTYTGIVKDTNAVVTDSEYIFVSN